MVLGIIWTIGTINAINQIAHAEIGITANGIIAQEDVMIAENVQYVPHYCCVVYAKNKNEKATFCGFFKFKKYNLYICKKQFNVV